MEKVSVIIPSYNIERSVSEVVNRCPKEYEVIVVDDGSKDRTREIAETTRARVIAHERNMGKGQAMITGTENATGDIIVFIDGDLQHIPEDIPRLVSMISDGGYDMVIGSRRLYDTKGMPLLRKVSNKISTSLVRLSLGIRIRDTQSGFRAIRKERLIE
ncbi:MAG TPA: glycosyltransferase family 2 protein, partial [Candidatus Methanofastidiosa archaeon]|nr:glycosyltransferase family 2 protein [Candidatus Methanofastidiosa archaeon]